MAYHKFNCSADVYLMGIVIVGYRSLLSKYLHIRGNLKFLHTNEAGILSVATYKLLFPVVAPPTTLMYVYTGKLNWGTYAINESFVLVFPTTFKRGEPVYGLWQWSVNSNGVKKANHSDAGYIDTISMKPNGPLNLAGSFDEYYRFEAIVGAESKTMIVKMKTPSNYEQTTTLKLTYSSVPSPASTYEESAPRNDRYGIYTGKLSWFNYAVNEMITIIVAPPGLESGSSILAFWQWTSNSKGEEKAPAVVQGKINSVLDSGDTRTVNFFQEEYYKFSAKVSQESGDVMTLTMRNLPFKDVSDGNILHRIYPPANRTKRGATKSTVKNNTDNAIFVTLLESQGSQADHAKILAGVSFGLGMFGALSAIPGAPVWFSLGLAVASLEWARIGLIDAITDTPPELRELLFPGDEMSRTSKFWSFTSDNDMIVEKTVIEDGILSVKRALKQNLGSGTLTLDTSFLNQMDFPEYGIQTVFTDAKARKMEYCTLVKFNGVKPSGYLEPGEKASTSVIKSVVGRSSGSIFSTTWEGARAEDPKYRGKWESGRGYGLLPDIGRTFWYLEAATRDGRKIVHLPESTRVIIRLRNYVVERFPGRPDDRVALPSNWKTDEDAQKAIKRNLESTGRKYRIFTFTSGGAMPVYGYMSSTEFQSIKYSTSSSDYVYLASDGFTYLQRIVEA
jgi:hypothetical protein